MGIGVWYEMSISDPVVYLFKNADPRGSLAANVSNATVRSLSNLTLDRMLQDRHAMSQTVRDEVTPQVEGMGLLTRLGLCAQGAFPRRGHDQADRGKSCEPFAASHRRHQASGANQVNIITSTAERQAAIEFAKAAAMRPHIVGEALQEISKDKEVSDALFQTIETQNIIDSQAAITLIPANSGMLGQLLAAKAANNPSVK